MHPESSAVSPQCIVAEADSPDGLSTLMRLVATLSRRHVGLLEAQFAPSGTTTWRFEVRFLATDQRARSLRRALQSQVSVTDTRLVQRTLDCQSSQ